jgi:hypothetical protein
MPTVQLKDEVKLKNFKFPKLQPIEKILYTVIFPLGMMYLLYCILLLIGIKRTRTSDCQLSTVSKYYEKPRTAFDPYAYSPGTSLWNFTHRN